MNGKWSLLLICGLSGLIGLFVIGCVEQTLKIDTEPEGALVYLNDQEVGRTPIQRDFMWYGDYEVEVRKDGYQTLHTHQWLVAPSWNWVPIDLIANLMPWHIHDTQTMAFKLTPTTRQLDREDYLLSRAEELRSQMQSSVNTTQPSTRSTSRPATRPATQPRKRH